MARHDVHRMAFRGQLPGQDDGLHWSRSDGTPFHVRCGPDYLNNGCKAASAPGLYECVGVDVVRARCIVSQVIGRLVEAPSSKGDGWTSGCPLPRILCIVVHLPYGCDWSSRSPSLDVNVADPGCSVVAMFAIKKETVEAARSDQPPASVRILRDFVQRASDQCPVGDKSSSGILKAIAIGENVDSLGMSSLLLSIVHRYNGTPMLVTRSGHVRKDPAGEWLEVNIDVRVWSFTARNALYNLRESLAIASVHCGFVIQGCKDDELPEGMIGACYIHNLDIMSSPRFVNDPRAGGRSGNAVAAE